MSTEQMHTGHLDKHMWAFWWESLILINHICDLKVLDSVIGNKKFRNHKMRSKVAQKIPKKWAKSCCKTAIVFSQCILKSNGVTKYCLYWWWMKLFMLVLSVWWKKGKAMKTFQSLTQHRSHMFHKMHSVGWTSCNIEAGDSFIISFFLYVVTSRNVMTYSQVTMRHCDIWWASKYPRPSSGGRWWWWWW